MFAGPEGNARIEFGYSTGGGGGLELYIQNATLTVSTELDVEGCVACPAFLTSWEGSTLSSNCICNAGFHSTAF